MKRTFKYCLMVLCAITAIGVTSCTEKYEYDPAAPEDKGAFLIASTTSYLFTPGEAQEFEITVQRRDTVEAGVVNLTSDNAKFNVPSEVSFAANEKAKTVKITSDLNSGSDETVSIGIAEGQGYNYGANVFTFNVKTPKKYVGTFSSYAFEDVREQVVYELGNGKYMLPDLYMKGNSVTFVIDWNTNKITVSAQKAWVDSYYGTVAVQGNGTYDAEHKMAEMTLTHYCSAGSFGAYKETFYFPEDFEPLK